MPEVINATNQEEIDTSEDEPENVTAFLSVMDNSALNLDFTEHMTISEGLASGGELALKGIHKEITSFMERDTGIPIKLTDIKDKSKIVPAGFLLKPKFKKDELVFKGRLIAYGNRQQHTEDMVVYAATANTTNIMMGLAWNAHLKNHLLHMDIETAFFRVLS